MNKEDEIEIYFNYSNDLEENIPSLTISSKSITLQLLTTNYLSRISNRTNIPTI